MNTQTFEQIGPRERDPILEDEELAPFEERYEADLDAEETALLPPARPASPVQRFKTSIRSSCNDGGRLKLAVNTVTGRVVIRCSVCGVEAGRGIRTRGKDNHDTDENL
ncbi:MAG TPA: hypothetical protein VMW52_05580 [Phycisphaerae bacterium]|nr:hypothetical protein [Phycisphaerae bacterium]